MRLLVFMGPSASGKSTLVRELQRLGLVAVTPTWTTRPRRSDEGTDTVEHRFVEEDEFDAREQAGFFLEVVRPFGLSYRYGLPAVSSPRDGRVPAIMVRARQLPLVAQHFPAHVSYQIEDRYERARARLLARDPLAVGTRLEHYEAERLLGRTNARRVFVNSSSVGALVTAVADAIAEDFPPQRTEVRECRKKG